MEETRRLVTNTEYRVYLVPELEDKRKGQVHPCAGTEALYRPCGP